MGVAIWRGWGTRIIKAVTDYPGGILIIPVYGDFNSARDSTDDTGVFTFGVLTLNIMLYLWRFAFFWLFLDNLDWLDNYS